MNLGKVKIQAREPGTSVVWDEDAVPGTGMAVIRMFAEKHQDVDIVSENEFNTLMQQYRGGILENQGLLQYLLIVDDAELVPEYTVIKSLAIARAKAERAVSAYVKDHLDKKVPAVALSLDHRCKSGEGG